MQTISKSRVNYKDQWASHPTLEERKTMLDQLAIEVDPVEIRAWELFTHPKELQEKMTTNLYKSANQETPVEEYDAAYFETWYGNTKNRTSLPAVYKGFYDSRLIDTADWDIDGLCTVNSEKSFHELFTEENGQLQSSIKTNETDLDIVTAIRDRQIDVSSFDFDGIKHDVMDAGNIIQVLQKDIVAQKEQLMLLDKEAFAFFCKKAGDKMNEIISLYLNYQLAEKQHNAYIEIAGRIMRIVSPFFSGSITIDQASAEVAALKETEEPQLKQMFQSFVDENIITKEVNETLYNKIMHFNSASYLYFVSNAFESVELNELCDLLVQVNEELHHQHFQQYKKMLEKQLEYLVI